MDWKLDFVEAKYHLVVAERMLKGYEEYPEKRFLVGVINESAKSASRLVRAFLIYDNSRGGLKKFVDVVGPKYLDDTVCDHLIKILEIERAQKSSPVEFVKKGKIILLIDGKYRILTADRLKEFVRSLAKGVNSFPGNL